MGWATPAYHKKDGSIQHPGACRHSLQYDGRPNGRFGVQFGTWNIDSLSGKGEEVDVCCLLEVRWRGLGVGMLEMKGRGYKLWWSGK